MKCSALAASVRLWPEAVMQRWPNSETSSRVEAPFSPSSIHHLFFYPSGASMQRLSEPFCGLLRRQHGSWCLRPKRTASLRPQSYQQQRSIRMSQDRWPFFSNGTTSSYFGQSSHSPRTFRNASSRLSSSSRPDAIIARSRATRREVWAIIFLNAAVFASWYHAQSNNDRKLEQFLHDHCTLSWHNINEGRYHTLITSAFSHNNTLHFGGNMFALMAFGSVIASAGVGPIALLGLSIGSALASSAAWLYHEKQSGREEKKKPWKSERVSGFSSWVRTFSSSPDQWGPRTIVRHVALGASGVVMGLGGAATCLAPMSPMYLMLIPIPIPLFVITGAYFAFDAFYLDKGFRIGDAKVGHSAHLGGVAMGVVYYLTFLRNRGGVWPALRRAVLKR